MANRLERVEEVSVTLGTPAQPAVPERCVSVLVGYKTVAVEVTETTVRSPTYSEYTTIDPVGVGGETVYHYTGTEQLFFPAPSNTKFSYDDGETTTYTVYKKVPTYELECTGGTPYIPGTPSVLTAGAGPDWLSYARSQPVVPESGGYDVTVTGPVLVGLMDPVYDGGYSLGAVVFGLYYTGSEVYPILGGVQGALLGTYTGPLSVTLSRQRGIYTAKVGGSVAYTANIAYDSPAALVAFLETSDASAYDPSVFLFEGLQATASGNLPLTGAATIHLQISAEGVLPLRGWCNALIDGELSALAGGSLGLHSGSYGELTTPITAGGVLGFRGSVLGVGEGGHLRGAPMELLASDHPYSVAELTVPKQALTAASASVPVTSFTSVLLSVPKTSMDAVMFTGGVITAHLTVHKASGIGSEGEYAVAYTSAPKMLCVGAITAGEPLAVMHSEQLAILGREATYQGLLVSLDMGDLAFSSVTELSLTMLAEVAETLQLQDDASLVQVVSAALDAKITLVGSSRPPESVDKQYLVTRLSGALSRATGLGFTQFVYGQGLTHGIRPDGLYLISGTSDEEFNAEVRFGASTFGSLAAKNMEAVFLGLATDGTPYLVLEADGSERVYRVTQRGTTARAHVAKGVTGRTWSVGLKLVDLTSADLDHIELVVGAARRWTR